MTDVDQNFEVEREKTRYSLIIHAIDILTKGASMLNFVLTPKSFILSKSAPARILLWQKFLCICIVCIVQHCLNFLLILETRKEAAQV